MPRLGDLQDYDPERAFTRRAPGVNPIALELDRLAALRHIPTRTALQPEDARAQDEAYQQFADEEAMRREAPVQRAPQPAPEGGQGTGDAGYGHDNYTDADFSPTRPTGEFGRIWRRDFQDIGREELASSALANLFSRGDVWVGDSGDYYSYFPMNPHQLERFRQAMNNLTPEQKQQYMALQPPGGGHRDAEGRR
jgi:hypothetical protein